jgi:FtsH-binding integral membrane protein
VDYSLDHYEHRIAAEAAADARATFIRRTYLHLAGAFLAFIGVEAFLVTNVSPEFIGSMLHSWFVLILAFMGVSWLANYWAMSGASTGLQYLGLGLYVAAEAVIFLPLLYVAKNFAQDEMLIPKAGLLTLCVFAGLSFIAFTTRRDFSVIGSFLKMAGFIALGVVFVSIFWGGGLGLWFSFAMVALAGGYILYYTSNILYHYRTDQHVAASLALFASVALLFYYILMIMMSSSRRN